MRIGPIDVSGVNHFCHTGFLTSKKQQTTLTFRIAQSGKSSCESLMDRIGLIRHLLNLDREREDFAMESA